MKKILTTLILSVLFCGNMFAQGQVTFYDITIQGIDINASSCNEAEYNIPILIDPQKIHVADHLIELYNEQIQKVGYDDCITVIRLNISSVSSSTLTLRISKNETGTRTLRINGANGGYVNVYQEICVPDPIISDITTGTNWIIKTTYKSADTNQYNRNITYYDALGAPEQIIQVKASPNNKNIIQPVVYDNMRRSDAKTYLPYASSSSSAYKESDVLNKQKTFYTNKFNAQDANYAYVEKIYEPAKPVSKKYSVGNIYRSQNKYTGYSYETNAANEVLILNVNTANGSLAVAGYYVAGSLYRNSVTDEDGIKVTTYTDKSGNTVLTRAKDNSNQNVDTYYAYDVKGQLRWTVSPEGSALLAAGNTYTATSDLAKKYCYTYKYDGRGNVIERRLPGKEAEYMVYDKGGRLVMFQDGVMRTSNQWIYNVYDDVNNLTDKSLVTGTLTRAQIQAKYYEAGFKNDYMSLVAANNIYRPFGYTYFTTVHLISSARYSGKKYYVRRDIPDGIYIRENSKYRSPIGDIITESDYNNEGYIDENVATIGIAGKIINEPSDTVPPPVILPLPVILPTSCPDCDTLHLYTYGNDSRVDTGTVRIKDIYLRYTDPNHSYIKYYDIPNEYMSIATCLTSLCSPIFTLFEGTPGGTETALWQTPSSLAFAPVAGVCQQSDADLANTKNMKAYETVKILTINGGFVERAFYYDKYGRLIQTVEKNHLGYISRYSVKYDFAGNVLAQHESHKTDANTTDTRLTVFTYDHRERMLTETTTINDDANSAATVSYEYDQLGQPVKKIFGDNAVTETKTYNIQGQLTRKQAKAGNDNIFDLQLKYHDATKATKSYSGNITELTWQHENLAANTYAYTYDKLKRLTGSLRYEGTNSAPLNTFTEQGITYDRNGNILTLKRYGATDLDSDLTYGYNGNMLVNLTGVDADAYTYDANGSMTHDGRRGFDVTYNLIDLPQVIKKENIDKARYAYLADGTKLGVESDSLPPSYSELVSRYTRGFDYIGSFVYTAENRVRTFESTNFAGGRISKTTSGYEITYYITDHLGSTRVIVDNAGNIKEQNDYYPFGMRHENSNLMTSTNRYLFSGKELQTTGEINYMDFGSRMYDDFLGRWFAIDPRAEDYYPLSPYAYCGNNPVNIVDPDGEFLGAILGAIGGFFNGLFSGENVFKSALNGLKNGFKIDMGWFKGNPLQILSRFTWEAPQTLLGYAAGVTVNTVFGVNSVTYYGGATVIETKFNKMGAFTLGSFITGQEGIKADPHNSLFQHEYGHYLQSQAFGWAYLSKVAVPSLIDEIANKGNHKYQSFEQDANSRAFMYFNEHEEGFYQTEAEYNYNRNKGIRVGWDFYSNPLDVYREGNISRGKYYDYKNPDHRVLINRLKISATIVDYVVPFGAVIHNSIYDRKHIDHTEKKYIKGKRRRK